LYNIIDEKGLITAELISWYRKHKRDLPWRNNHNPYHIWLSEIILQQTRVAQGLSYFIKFTTNYPSVIELANANEEEILKDWQGLGYYSRARNLHAAAKSIVEDYNGVFPDNYTDIRALKGVGDYTAAAIASFAFDLPYAVLDGNVFRFISRFFGIKTPIDSSKGKKDFQAICQELLDKDNPAEFNQAIMEFGALQCTPKQAACASCPFQTKCYAYSNQMVNQLPVKKNKTKQRNRYFQYLIIQSKNELLIKQRKSKGIWQNLFDFPLIEFEQEVNSKKLLKSEAFLEIINGKDYHLEATSKSYKHILSHQIIYANFHHLKVANFDGLDLSEFVQIKNSDLEEYPIPKLIENYLKEETNLLSLLDT
jgi:A/G-specific adenine glycosylase